MPSSALNVGLIWIRSFTGPKTALCVIYCIIPILKCIHRLSPYRAVNILRLSYKEYSFYIWVSVHHKSIIYNNQQDAILAVLCLLKTTSMLYMFRTTFASIFRSTINCNSSHWPWNSRVLTDLDIYTGFIPTHDKHQWLLLQFIVLLKMDAKDVRNM